MAGGKSLLFYSDAFCLNYDGTTRSVKALNGSGRAPERLSIEYLRSRGITGNIPPTDLNSVTVPGSWILDSWYTRLKVLIFRCRRCVGRHRGGVWKWEAKRGRSFGASDPSRRRRVRELFLQHHLLKAQVDAALKLASLCLRSTVIGSESLY